MLRGGVVCRLQQQLAAEASEQVREAPVVQVTEAKLPVAILPPAEELTLDRACGRVVVAARQARDLQRRAGVPL